METVVTTEAGCNNEEACLRDMSNEDLRTHTSLPESLFFPYHK